jgi:hypothetical protein
MEFENRGHQESAFQTEDWYLDDDKVGELYNLIGTKQLDSKEAEDLHSKLQIMLESDLTKEDESHQHLDRLSRINLIVRNLNQYLYESKNKSGKPESPIEPDIQNLDTIA